MINKIILILICLFISNVSLAGRYKKAKFSTCSYGKITPINYLAYYNITKKRYKRYARNSKGSSFQKWSTFLELETTISTNKSSESCEWNKFILTDFIFYHEQATSLFGVHNKLLFLELRDEFYKSWLVALEEKTQRLEKKSNRTSLNDIHHQSNGFEALNSVTNLFNPSPAGKGEVGMAELEVYNLLEGKSVFNSIFSSYAQNLFLNKESLYTAKCISRVISTATGENLWNEFQICNKSSAKILDILGVLSSQRMYLIRDYKEVMYRNLNDHEYTQVSELFDVTSMIYFQLETYGNKFGHEQIYPVNMKEKVFSQKPYHFYSVAFIALKLKKQGYSNEIIKKASVKYARQYKKNIKRVGIIYNILLLQNINKGTVGDYDNVLKEQDLGALFGIEVGNEYD
jgi:hypothetical protein